MLSKHEKLFKTTYTKKYRLAKKGERYAHIKCCSIDLFFRTIDSYFYAYNYARRCILAVKIEGLLTLMY